MVLKDLKDVLQGSINFKLQSKNEAGEVENIDEVLPYEIKYLPANLLKRNILRIDLDAREIFLASAPQEEN